MHQPLRLRCDAIALCGNYNALRARAGTSTGAAVKANAYGLGAKHVVRLLLQQGCRDFFVSTWWEAEELDFVPDGGIAVLHGWGANDTYRPGVRPVLISSEQIARWKTSGQASSPCDLMVDTGMNRLGLSLEDLSAADGLNLHTVHSHLACADEDHELNAEQLRCFISIRLSVKAQRYSLANSAGIFLGPDYAFDLVRPGLALYGGIPRDEARSVIRPVFTPEAQVLQLRTVSPGESVGYNATFVAKDHLTVAILNLGYADGYWRALGSHGFAIFEQVNLPIIGRISMDLIAVDATGAQGLREGDWVQLPFDLESMAAASGYSQYELLTGLGRRWQRCWT
jgi:alanine racemase